MQPFALFDLDNTLIDRQAALKAWAADFAESRLLPRDAERLITHALAARAHPRDFEHLRELLDLEEPADALWRGYVAGMADRVACYPGVHRGLRELRRGRLDAGHRHERSRGHPVGKG